MKNYNKENLLFKYLEPPFVASEDQLWTRIESQLGRSKKPTVFIFKKVAYAVAAALVLCLAVGSFFRFYTTQIEVPKGGFQAHRLPDGSQLVLNASSSLEYHPYWWSFERKVKLEGEAFFEVKPGSFFKVLSEKGSTEVLGTTFNIYARGKNYSVYCESGTVKVSNTNAQQPIILEAGEMATLKNTAVLKKSSSVNPKQITGWKENKLAFDATPLPVVIAEIERQYNVRIFMDSKTGIGKSYSAYFDKPTSADTTLRILSESLNLKVIKLNIDQYQIQSSH